MTLSNAQDYSNYIGIPYRSPDSNQEGLNCWELVEKIMIEQFKLKPPIVHYSGPVEKVAPVFMSQLLAWDLISNEHRAPGDLILLSITGYPVHCGILINETQFIHTLKSCNSCIESISSISWKKRILGFYRWKTKTN